ncbi:MAG: hypothetical protein Q8K75_06285 [Chlamydiales bacterium]|nr:hypothetical protein [Chlamydiales bacterium]
MFVSWPVASRSYLMPPVCHVPCVYSQAAFLSLLRREVESDRRRSLASKCILKLRKPPQLTWWQTWEWGTHFVDGSIPGLPGHTRSCLGLVSRLVCR